MLTGELRIEHSTIRRVQATNGAYHYIDFGLYADNSHLRIGDSVFTDNGGSTNDYGIYVTGSSSVVTLTNTTLTDNAGYGLRVNGGQVSMSCGEATINSNNGLYVTGGTFFVSGASIAGNVGYGLRNTTASVMDARDNWWGDASGPSGVGPGTGDAVSSNVLYDPWLTTPGCVIPPPRSGDPVLPAPSGLVLTLSAPIFPPDYSGPFDPVLATTPLTYTVQATNYGPEVVRQVILTGLLPSGLVILSATTEQGASCSQSDGVTLCDLGELAPQSTTTIVLVAVAEWAQEP